MAMVKRWQLVMLFLAILKLNEAEEVATLVITDGMQLPHVGGGNDPLGAGTTLKSPSWLEEWLWNLQLEIPDVSDVKGGFNLSVSDGLCTHFKIGKIDTVTQLSGLHITASGLEIFCRLQWSAKSRVLPLFHGDVVAQIKNASIGGPVEIVSDALQPPLPKAINAHDCSGSIEADLAFSGSGVSMVLEFLKPLIQTIMNKKLTVEICEKLDAAIDGPGSKALQNASQELRKILQSSPTPPPTPVVEDPKKELIDFQQNSGMELLHSVVTKVLGNQRSPNSANALLEHFLGTDGNLSLNSLVTLPLTEIVNIDNLGRFNITVESASFSHLNSVSAMDFYSPTPQELQFLLSLAHLAVQARLTVGVKPHGTISGDELKETFTTSLAMSDFSVGALGFLAINGSKLAPLGADQLGEMGCVAPGIDAAAALQCDIDAKQISTKLTPHSGQDLEHDVDHLINSAVALLLGTYKDALGVAGHALLIARGMEMVNNKLQSSLQNVGACPPPFEDYSNATLSGLALLLCLTSFVVSMMFCMSALVRPKKIETRQMCQSTSVASTGSTRTEPTSLAVETGTYGSYREGDGSADRSCLAFHPRIRPAFRWGLPFLMVATMLLFLSSNSGVGAVVKIYVTANGRPVADIPPVFGFSLIGSIKDMFDGKVYALGLLIICFSGLWPYIKPMLMMMCWFMPPKHLSIEKRQGLLNFLDAFGKWSLVDTFVMVLFMVAFKFDLAAPQGKGILNDILRESGDEGQFQVQVEALYGFYSFLVATFMSLICGHITTACHRYAHKIGEFGVDSDATKSRLCERHDNPVDRHGPTIAISVSLVLVLCGTFLQTFNFNFLGLAGYALGPEQNRPFSVFSLGMQIPEASKDPSSPFILALQGVFFLFAIIVVVLYHVILIILWTAKMPTRMQKQFFLTAQVLNAWSGLDVFCVTILAGVLEIRQFADFIVGNKCDQLDALLAKSPIADQMPGGVVSCFDVDSTLRAGFLVLAVAVVISTITGQVMLHRCSLALCSLNPR